MFHYRSSDFSPSMKAIQKHLGAVEKELENIGRIAGRRGSAAASVASEQVGDAITTILNEMINRLREQGRAAGNQAARIGDQAVKTSTAYGADAMQRVAAEVEGRPLITLGVALGLGILIGAAVLRNRSSS
jgi:ElaB/YqjD/DUF883 family membrane-anchored ribosome-binding protein